MEIFVGNLPFDVTEQEITDVFAAYGAVSAVKMLMDKMTGRFRGIAFVTMSDDAQAQQAMDALNGKDLGGRPMRIDKTRERSDRFNGEGGGFGGKHRSGGFGGNRGGFGGNRGGGFKPRGAGNGGGFKRDGFKPKSDFRRDSEY